MFPEALGASLRILLKFLLSAVPGSHSELAANALYYLRPFTQGGNTICIQVKHMFLCNSKEAHEQSDGSQKLCHHPQRFMKETQAFHLFYKTRRLPCILLEGGHPSFFLMYFLGL